MFGHVGAVMAALDRKTSQRRRTLLPAPSLLSVLLTITFTFLHQRPASAQPGFLSLDCGAPAPYKDARGISWVPDDAYISGGKKSPVIVDDPHLQNLRFFPDSTRNCYSLPTSPGQTYLVRAGFYHGNYDSTSTEVRFGIALDVFATRETIVVDQVYDYFWEYVFRGFKNTVQFCLFRMSPSDTPFISYLELRPLDNTMYATVADGSALGLTTRRDYGLASSTIRYPEDPYDRFWIAAPGSNSSSLQTVTSTSVVNTGFAVDKPPPAVMNTALSLEKSLSGSVYIWSAIDGSSFRSNAYLVNLFLAELEPSIGLSRTFDVHLNDETLWLPTVNIYRDASNSLYTPVQYTTNRAKLNASGILKITLTRSASTSGPPPLVNALEFFSIHKKQPATLASEVSAIEGLKEAFGLGAAWPGDPCLELPYDWLLCTAESPPRISAVKLSSAGLAGRIPDLRALTSLTTLHLDNNKLTGSIPAWLASLPNLRELHLQNNNLTGNVPKGLLTLPVLRVEGNPGLCLDASCSEEKKSNTVMIIVGVVAGVLVVVGIAIAITVVMCCCCGRQPLPAEKVPETGNNPLYSERELEEGKLAGEGRLDVEGSTAPRGSRYTLAQVMVATNNHAKMLGRGGFGPVYYGKLASGQEVAVKVSAKGSNQGSKEFMNEIELLTRVHHKNLVSLVGYCDEGDNLILLYEYMPLGTVQEHLYVVGTQEKSNSVLDWKTRLQIALNSAQGLEYLHTGCNPVIFHRDVKSNNILLNEKMIAKVADFGLSKSAADDNVTHMTTMVRGTIGYLDPEYYSSNQLTDKSDVFAFGIVLLEIICARPPFVPQLPQNQSRIDQWVRRQLEAGSMEEIVDRALVGQYNADAMWKVVDLAMMSVKPKGKHRPSMCTIVQELRAAVDIENSDSSSFSRPSHHASSSSASTFDIQQSSSSVSDPQIMASSHVQAR